MAPKLFLHPTPPPAGGTGISISLAMDPGSSESRPPSLRLPHCPVTLCLQDLPSHQGLILQQMPRTCAPIEVPKSPTAPASSFMKLRAVFLLRGGLSI